MLKHLDNCVLDVDISPTLLCGLLYRCTVLQWGGSGGSMLWADCRRWVHRVWWCGERHVWGEGIVCLWRFRESGGGCSRAGFSWWEAWGPARAVTLVWKVGELRSKHLKRRGLRCWRHWEGGWGMGVDTSFSRLGGLGQWSNYIIILWGGC